MNPLDNCFYRLDAVDPDTRKLVTTVFRVRNTDDLFFPSEVRQLDGGAVEAWYDGDGLLARVIIKGPFSMGAIQQLAALDPDRRVAVFLTDRLPVELVRNSGRIDSDLATLVLQPPIE